MINEGVLKCIDPSLMETSYFYDMVGGSVRMSAIKFTACDRKTDKACLSEEAHHVWLQTHTVTLDFWMVSTTVDYSVKEDYFSWKLEWINSY